MALFTGYSYLYNSQIKMIKRRSEEERKKGIDNVKKIRLALSKVDVGKNG